MTITHSVAGRKHEESRQGNVAIGTIKIVFPRSGVCPDGRREEITPAMLASDPAQVAEWLRAYVEAAVSEAVSEAVTPTTDDFKVKESFHARPQYACPNCKATFVCGPIAPAASQVVNCQKCKKEYVFGDFVGSAY